MADAIKASTIVKIEAQDTQFGTSGNRIVFPGFIRAYVEGKDDPEAALEDSERLLPELQVGDTLTLHSLESVSHETKAPARFTEATLVQELEKKGIGRPSTYAPIIDRLFEKAYVVKDGTALVPTFVAFAVIQLIERHFGSLVDYEFTSDMEDHLDAIAEGKAQQLDYLKTFYEGEKGLKSQVDEKLESVSPAEAKKIELPHISEPITIMIGRFGPYVVKEGEKARSSIPQDYYPGNISQSDLESLIEIKNGEQELQSIGTDPETNLDVYLLSGKFGPYYQLGLKSDENPKPKTASVPKGVDLATLEFEKVLQYLNLPRTVGLDPDTNKDVVATIGRYGPYVGSNGEFRSLPNEEAVFSITLKEALALLAQPKPTRGGQRGKRAPATPIKEFKEYEGKALAVYNGRYGYYGKWGKINFPLPNEMKKDLSALEALTQQMMEDLADKKK
jgi:DNA topoisomerase-1